MPDFSSGGKFIGNVVSLNVRNEGAIRYHDGSGARIVYFGPEEMEFPGDIDHLKEGDTVRFFLAQGESRKKTLMGQERHHVACQIELENRPAPTTPNTAPTRRMGTIPE